MILVSDGCTLSGLPIAAVTRGHRPAGVHMNLLCCSSGGQRTDASLSGLTSRWWWRGQRSFWRFQGRKCLPGFPQLLEAAGLLGLSAPSVLCPQSAPLRPLLLSSPLLLPNPPNSLCDDISPPGQSRTISLFHKPQFNHSL